MKKLYLLSVVVFITFSAMAQLHRALPVNSSKAVLPESTSKTEMLSAIRGTVTQNFESITDFSLDFSPWTTRDVDGYTTYGIEGYDFLHSGEAMAFIAFNPGATTPSLTDDLSILPHGGMKYAACFASTSHPNNDWLISPLIELDTNGKLKFWVKSYTSNYGLERYKVGVSTTNTEPASFTIISSGNYLEAPADAWEQKIYDLSAYAGKDIFIGIQCVSDNAFILMLDDFEITSGPVGIDETAWEQEVGIYPNPANSQLHVNSGINIKSLSLVDLNGLERLRQENCGNMNTLEVGKIPDGIYILKVDTEKGVMQRKINVLR